MNGDMETVVVLDLKRRVCRPNGGNENDPVLAGFPGFLSHDIASHPEPIRAVDAGFVQRLQSLLGDGEIDLDAPLSADDE